MSQFGNFCSYYSFQLWQQIIHHVIDLELQTKFLLHQGIVALLLFDRACLAMCLHGSFRCQNYLQLPALLIFLDYCFGWVAALVIILAVCLLSSSFWTIALVAYFSNLAASPSHPSQISGHIRYWVRQVSPFNDGAGYGRFQGWFPLTGFP